jgi:hypothetical protein
MKPALAVLALFAGLSTGCATALSAAPSCPHPLDSRIANGCIVADGKLWRGAKPDRAAAAALVDLGVKTVVNLELLHSDIKAFSQARPVDPARQDIRYFQVPDWEPLVVLDQRLVDDHIAHFLAITRTQPAPVYVHCRSGQNRTGIMVAAYRIFNGEDMDATIRDMASYHGLWSAQDAAYLRTLTPERRAAIEVRISDWIGRLKASAGIQCLAGRCTVSGDDQ